jgi:hypothetical protein
MTPNWKWILGGGLVAAVVYYIAKIPKERNLIVSEGGWQELKVSGSAVQDLLDELLSEASAMAPKPSPAAPPPAVPQPPQLSQALEPHEQPHKSDDVSTVAPPLPLPPPTTLLPPLPLPPTLKGEQGAAPADGEGGRHRVSDEDAAQQRAARLEALAAEARWLEKALRDRIQVRCAV